MQLSWLANIKKVDVLLGDYNIDSSFYEDYTGFYSALTQRKLNCNLTYPSCWSLIRSCIFDEIIFSRKRVDDLVKNILYFSDHDAIKFHVQRTGTTMPRPKTKMQWKSIFKKYKMASNW